MTKTREAHLAWCKQRAHEAYAYSKNVQDGIASMLSDLGKHEGTRNLVETAGMLMFTVKDEASLRRFIDGFN